MVGKDDGFLDGIPDGGRLGLPLGIDDSVFDGIPLGQLDGVRLGPSLC